MTRRQREEARENVVSLLIALLYMVFGFFLLVGLPAALSVYSDPAPGQTNHWKGNKMR